MATAALLVTAPAHAGPAPARAAASPPSPAPVADGAGRVFDDLAGSAAGAGRDRPGRPAGEPANPDTVLAAHPVPVRPRTEPPDPPAPVPATSPPPVVSALGTEPNERAADLAAHLLPLGTGFALMGLGFGFLGVRLRRGR